MPEVITSIHNPRVKAAAQLREARQRRKQGRILIDGAREVLRSLGTVRPSEVFYCPSLCTSAESREAIERVCTIDAHLFEVSPAVFEKLAFGERAEGIVIIAPTPHASLSDVTLPACPLVAVLEGVEKPGNVGAVLRSANGAGVSPVIVADGGTDLYNPNTIRASLGTIFTMPVIAATAAETLTWLRANNLAIFAARVDGDLEYSQADFTQPCAIILGSEADGLTDFWNVPQITSIRLPMLGTADSLNISAAAAVLFYEARRQRHCVGQTFLSA